MLKVESIRIRNFRSISHCELTNCGGFNVLIGKNNSGKSNILSAINAFFSAIEDGDVVCLDSLIDQEVDFHHNKVDIPVEIALTFVLTDQEMTELAAHMVEDSPQMTNAVNNLDHESRLCVSISFEVEPNTVSA